MSGLGLTFLRRGGQAHPTVGSDYIKFADETVFNILMSKGVSSDGVGITKDDAARVTNIGTWFRQSSIEEFVELEYFSITQIPGSAQSGGAFQACDNLRKISMPESVTKIGSYGFNNCANLDNIGDILNVTSIESYALSGCLKLAIEVNAPSLSNIGNKAFMNSGISAVKDLGRVSSIPGNSSGGCFQNCANMTIFYIPASVTSIGAYALYNCPNLRTLVSRAVEPPTLASTSISGTPSDMIIYVPDASVDAYKAASGWSTYASRIKGISEYNG